jgi:chromosome segregation ATPase
LKRLLDTLEHDEPEIRQRLSESSRQMHVVRAHEKQLRQKCAALEDTDRIIIKENEKMRIEIIEMEIAVKQRIGYLERYKDMANFRIKTLQRQLEESVPISKLDTVNREYNDIVQKYRQLLDKQDQRDMATESLHQTEELNRKFENEIVFLRKELENEKDKTHLLEESLERLKDFQHSNTSTKKEYYSALKNGE